MHCKVWKCDEVWTVQYVKLEIPVDEQWSEKASFCDKKSGFLDGMLTPCSLPNWMRDNFEELCSKRLDEMVGEPMGLGRTKVSCMMHV